MATAQEPSPSKLSAHLINSYTVGASNIVAGHPRVLKILDVGAEMLQAARAYKAATPAGKVLLRVYTSKAYDLASNPAASATNFWQTVLKPALDGLSVSDRALIDYVEGPNEGDSTPTWQSLQAAEWFSTFWQSLSPLIAAAGFKPCVGSIAVGNPPGSTSEMQSYISALVPALRQAKALGGGWSYHAYTLNYSTDVALESYYSLRYRQFYGQFSSQYPDLLTLPLILSEGGVDQSGTPSTSGWQARGTAADYERWLNWFDHQIKQDSYVLGCTLFEIGNPAGWSSFDLEPIGEWLGAYLSAPTNTPPIPSGLSVVATNGTAWLTWTSTLASPTAYTVKRARDNGGPYLSIATGITEGVRATMYTDISVTNGGTYYYVVSAVNAWGESPNSTQAVVTLPDLKLPDVVVTSVGWTSNHVFAGNPVTFRVGIKNQGTGPTPAGIVLGVGFSIDGGPNVSWSGSYTTSLAPGGTVVLTADGGPTGSSTWTATPGAHTLTATVDDINRFPESNESNNSLSLPLAISTGPPRLGSVTLSAGNKVNLSFTGTAGVSYQLKYKNRLTDLQWSLYGSVFTAKSNLVWVSDFVTNSPQRFYRVEQTN